MDVSDRKRRNIYQYVPRHRPKINTNQTIDKHHHHSNTKHHHSNGGHHHHGNGGHHHHHSNGDRHHNHNIEKQGTDPLLNHLDKNIVSKHDQSTSEITLAGHEGHNHVTSVGENNPDIQQHFDHEIAMNHTIHQNMHSKSDPIHNLTHHHSGVFNSTMTLMPHGGNHGNGHFVHHGHHDIHDHILHSKVNQGHDGHMMEGEGHHHGMQMYFSLKTDSYFLIEGLRISSTEGILCAMLFTIALTIVMETLAAKIHLRERHRKHLKGFSRLGYHFVTTVIHLMNVGFAYIGMLCVMSMNIWLLVSVIVGSGVGHLLMKPMLLSCCSKPHDHVTMTSDNGNHMDTTEKLLKSDTSTTPNGHRATETDVFVA